MHLRIARIAGALAVCLALAGCAIPTGTGGGSIVETGKDNASIVTCRTNRALLAEQYSMALSGAIDSPTDFTAFVAEQKTKCPSGGTFTWDAAAGKVRCSIHGE